MIYIGYNIGSSYITAAAVDIESGKRIAIATAPEKPMESISAETSFSEQDPELWWKYLKEATHKLISFYSIRPADIKGIGISYQIHGLVCLNAENLPVRNAILEKDKRSQPIGNEGYVSLGAKFCKEQLLNAPSHFAASSLKWIKINEPELYKDIDKIMTPGDYIGLRFSDQATTTIAGLSEGILWNFKKEMPSIRLIEEYDLEIQMIPKVIPSFGDQGEVTSQASEETGIPVETPILYRASDASSLALAMNVLNPGELAISCQNEGLLYAITEAKKAKELERFTQIAHLNHQEQQPRISKVLKLNGIVPALSWLKNITQSPDFVSMGILAAQVEIGCKNLQIFPFGNGPETLFKNKDLGFHLLNGDTQIHDASYLCRATLESIAFTYIYAIELLKKEGLQINKINTSKDDILSSEVVGTTMATLLGLPIDVFETSSCIGAARACSISLLGHNSFLSYSRTNDLANTYKPATNKAAYVAAYSNWLERLHVLLNPKLSNKFHKQS